MRLKIVLVALSAVCLSFYCAETKPETIRNQDGQKMSNDTLSPEVVSVGMPLVAIQLTGSKYGPVGITAAGKLYSLNSLGKKPYLKRIEEAGFKGSCEEYVSNPGLPLICGTGTRDFQILDIEKNSVVKDIINSDGKARISCSYLFKGDKPVLLLTVEHEGWNENDSYETTYRYDFDKKKAEPLFDDYYASLWLQLDNGYFLRENMQREGEPSVWQLMKEGFRGTISNKLTKALFKLVPDIYKNNYNREKKFLVVSANDSNYTKYTISWDSLFEDIAIIPWTFQEPKDVILGKDFQFSPDGNWLRNTASLSDGPEGIVYNVFHHVSCNYPAFVSIPVFGFKGDWGSPGAFLETPEWGTVYVDLSEGINGILYVYKMRDVMERITARAAEMK